MDEDQILNEYKSLLIKLNSNCKKFGGAVAVEIIRDALFAEGFNVSGRDVYIEGIPIEIDLIIAKPGAYPEKNILYRQSDVLFVFEIKSRGTFGEMSVNAIKQNFKRIKETSSNIECIYLTISDRDTYKWKATDENIKSPAFTLFWHTGPEDNLNFKSTGDWKILLATLKKIADAS